MQSVRSQSRVGDPNLLSHRRFLLVCLPLLIVGVAGCGAGIGQGPGDDLDRDTMGETTIPGGPTDGEVVVDPSGNTEPEPTVSFTAAPSFCCDPLAIDFSANLSNARLASNAVFDWEFGDGHSDHGTSARHTFAWHGDYTVVLTVHLPNGSVLRMTRILHLHLGEEGQTEVHLDPARPSAPEDDDTQEDPPSLQGPVADAGPDRYAHVGETVILDGSGSFSRDGHALRFRWSQTRGRSAAISGADSPVARITAPELFGETDILTFELRVTQGRLSALDRVSVIVEAAPEEPPQPDPADDLDGDGLPDAWEVKYFGSAGRYGADADPDGDGAVNMLEYRYGTNPKSPDVNQLILNQLDVAIRSFWATGGRFEHAGDGMLVGWPMVKTVDGGQAFWGVDDNLFATEPVISMMGPGVPDVGLAFLRAYEATGNKLYLEYAVSAARTLLSVQKDLETAPDGSPRPMLVRGAWVDFAVVVRDNADTRDRLPDEIGHWTTFVVPGYVGDVDFESRLDSYTTFDDSISTSPAMFLLELYAALKDRDFSGEVVDPLGGTRPEVFLSGAAKFLNLADGYRSGFELRRSDFENIYIEYPGNPQKSGPHPFVAYLAGSPDHPLNNGGVLKPYANGGLPHGAVELNRLITNGGTLYGALAAGLTLHKVINDHVISRYLLFLSRYHEVTGDELAGSNLQLQLTWLSDVFQAQGNRGWCQQYHVLDDACAPARPYEPPAFATMEGVAQIARLAVVEKRLEEQLGLVRNDVRQMVEDAVFYNHRVVQRDEWDKLFQYYAVDAYDPTTNPSGYPALRANDPLFTCDYYYPQDPFKPCSAPYNGLAYQMFLIDEEHNGEFVAPNGDVWLSDLLDGALEARLIADQCVQDPGRADYRGCLDLYKTCEGGEVHFYDMDWRYWGTWLEVVVDDYLAHYLPNDDGLWTSTLAICDTQRTVVDTLDFRRNVLGLTRFLQSNGSALIDKDSDGLADRDERLKGTDPFHPDSDGDGARDGDELAAGTDPLNPNSRP